MPEAEGPPQRRRGERRNSGNEITPLYLLDRIEGLVSAINTAVDVVGSVSTKAGQNSLTLETHETRISKLERWQARTLGMFAVITTELTMGIGLAVAIYLHYH